MPLPKTEETLAALTALLGPQGVLTNPHDIAPYMREWRGRLHGKTPAILLPSNTDEVASIVKHCAGNGIPLVPQGGNTGLVGAGIPLEETGALLISLKRMNKIRALDAVDYSMVAEAGCILANVQKAALEADRYFALTLASEGSATIGGLCATNAGGALTLRYRNMREQVLGLEAVLPDGRIWNGLKTLRKNNTGYDLKQLLIGSEGTLGIITAASLMLMPRPHHIETAFLAFETPEKAIAALSELRSRSEDTLAVFELLPQIAIESAVKFSHGIQPPFAQSYPWAALIETHGLNAEAQPFLMPLLEALLEKELIVDATPAASLAQAEQFWRLREAVVAVQKRLGASLKHDLAVPIGNIPRLLEEGDAVVQHLIPGARLYAFGHAGDGNLHFNISQPEGMASAAFTEKRGALAAALHDCALSLGGAISAEHGIGRFKRDEFHRTASPETLSLVRSVKAALDPMDIMNPGVLV